MLNPYTFIGTIIFSLLTPGLKEPGGAMPHSQGLSNNPYPELNNPIPRIDTYFYKIHSNIVFHHRLGLPKCLFPIGLHVTILKALLQSYILAT